MSLREDLRTLIAKYGLPSVHSELQTEMRETYAFLRSVFEPPKNNLVIPVAEFIPNHVATPLHKPVPGVTILEPPQFDLEADLEDDIEAEVQAEASEAVSVSSPPDLTLKEVVIQAKSEMNRQFGEKFTKAKHKEEVQKKFNELKEKGINPQSLLTKENLTKWLGEGMSYMRIAREIAGVPENEIAALAKTFGLQSDIKKYIVMKKGAK
jgi:hypothetical protein